MTIKEKINLEVTVDNLLLMLDEEILDPRFENYGGFMSPYNVDSLNPQASDELKASTKEKQENGTYSTLGNFYGFSWGFSLDIPADRVAEVSAKILENRNKKEYIKALNEMYNCISIERVIFYGREIDPLYKNWFRSVELSDEYNLDLITNPKRSEELEDLFTHFKEESKGLDEENKLNSPSFLSSEVRIKYKEKHFRNKEEANELKEYTFKKSGNNSKFNFIQVRRVLDSSAKFEKIKLKSTGRELEIFVDLFSWKYREIDPIVK